MDLLTSIRRHLAFSTTEARLLADLITLRRVRRGQVLVRQGSVLDALAFLEKGCLRIFSTDARGRTHTIQFAVEGDWTGDLGSFQDGAPARYTIQALESCTLRLIASPDFGRATLDNPRVDRLFRLLYQKAYLRLQDRLISSMAESATARYERFRRDFAAHANRIPDVHIASYLGIAPETLSRIRARRGVS